MRCHSRIDFYDRLLNSTLALVFAVTIVWLGVWLSKRNYFGVDGAYPSQRAHKKRVALARYISVYICLFAYPVVAVKVVDAFGCHEVEGVY